MKFNDQTFQSGPGYGKYEKQPVEKQPQQLYFIKMECQKLRNDVIVTALTLIYGSYVKLKYVLSAQKFEKRLSNQILRRTINRGRTGIDC